MLWITCVQGIEKLTIACKEWKMCVNSYCIMSLFSHFFYIGVLIIYSTEFWYGAYFDIMGQRMSIIANMSGLIISACWRYFMTLFLYYWGVHTILWFSLQNDGRQTSSVFLCFEIQRECIRTMTINHVLLELWSNGGMCGQIIYVIDIAKVTSILFHLGSRMFSHNFAFSSL